MFGSLALEQLIAEKSLGDLVGNLDTLRGQTLRVAGNSSTIDLLGKWTARRFMIDKSSS